MIIGSIYNPKQDTDKLNAILKQYIDEMVAASGMQQ